MIKYHNLERNVIIAEFLPDSEIINFAVIESKSLRDFIRDSNNRGIINFVKSLEEGISRIGKG